MTPVLYWTGNVLKDRGVRIVWIDSDETVRQRQDGALHLTVILLSRDMAEKKISANRIADHVLGQSHLSSGRAYIFCDRIAAVPSAPTLFPVSLGNVIAHEMGHLVLRENSHSHNGIMRANVDLHAIHLQNFDKVAGRHHPRHVVGTDGRRHRAVTDPREPFGHFFKVAFQLRTTVMGAP